MYSRSPRNNQGHAPSHRDLAFRILLILFFVLLACGAPFAAYSIFATSRDAILTFGAPSFDDLPIVSVRRQPAPAITPPNISAGERVNILLLGTDCRPNEKPCRTDTMMLASLDPKTYSAGLVTIPRDLYVPIPGFGESRINTANFLGDAQRVPGGGPALAKQTVELNTGRKVHYYVLVDFNGFRRLVDTLGGIDIDVARPIYDPCYPDDKFGCAPLSIPAGRIHMNGDLALKYARTRHQGGDFDRMKRQIQVLLAARDKALGLDLIPKLPTLIQQLWASVQTDLTPQQIVALAPVAAKVKTDNIKSATIDQTMTVEFRTSQGADVLWPDRAKIGRLMDEIIPRENEVADGSNAIQKEAASILILNGTATPALGEKTAKFLQTQGFQVAAFGNADRLDYSRTVLIDYSGSKNATLSLLATTFHVAPENIRRISNVKSDVEIRLILGADWVQP
jgi:polyisoprenyl-teichoic acid--peptidoglycan teichoic acid transferase